MSRPLMGPPSIDRTVGNTPPHEPSPTVGRISATPRIVRYRTPSETGQFDPPLTEPSTLLNERRLDEFTSRDLIAAQPFQSSLIRDRRFVR